MTSPIGIAYFTGTGNTQLVAERLETALQARGAPVDLVAIEDVLQSHGRWQTEPYKRIVVGWPVHALSAPRIVREFIHRLPDGRGKLAATFRTAGDPYFAGGPPEPVRGFLASRGYRVDRECLFVMPANVLMRYPPAVERQLYLKAVGRSEALAEKLLDGETGLTDSPWLARAIAAASSAGLRVGSRLQGRLWRTTSDCTLCNWCVSACPVGNISRDLDRVRFGWDCMMCMRCVYGCPESAIRPSPVGRLFRLRDGYDTERMADASLDGEQGLSKASTGLYRRLYQYLVSPDP